MFLARAEGRTSEPLESSSSSSRLTREQVVDRILTMNPTATTDFLGDFPESSLLAYLEHLLAASQPRGRSARWVRPGDSPAIVGRRSRV
jgi:hypothetical protein